MSGVEYIAFQELNRTQLLDVVNKERVRKHLVSHDAFDEATLEAWIASKVDVDMAAGCKVRGIKVDGDVAGWCGIQYENGGYELAIVLDPLFWGIGVAVFKDVMEWASELGHREVALHLFNTRPEYKFLKKMASRVYESEMFGQRYTSYLLRVQKPRG